MRPPKQTATWTFGDSPAAVEYVDQPAPRLYVDLVVNGVKGKFILDTGAAGTAVVDSFARKIAERFGTTAIAGIGEGVAKANLFRVSTIGIGSSTLHDVIISSGLDEEDFAHEGAVGLIGFDLLGGQYRRPQPRREDASADGPDQGRAPDDKAGMVVHVDLSNGNIRTPMRLNDKFDVIATLDSGNPSDILFSHDLIDHERLVLVAQYNVQMTGVSGTELESCGKLGSLSLGPVRYTAPTGCASPSFARNEILVGLDFMHAFNYVFDYPDGIIVMTPRKNY